MKPPELSQIEDHTLVNSLLSLTSNDLTAPLPSDHFLANSLQA